MRCCTYFQFSTHAKLVSSLLVYVCYWDCVFWQSWYHCCDGICIIPIYCNKWHAVEKGDWMLCCCSHHILRWWFHYRYFNVSIPFKEHNRLNINTCIRNLDTDRERDRKQFNIFERKVYRRILGPVYDNNKENWRLLTNKEIYVRVKKPAIIETVTLNRLH